MTHEASTWDAGALALLSRRFEEAPPEEIVRWAVETFHPRIALACSFGAEDVALVDMAARVREGVRVFYLDTGLHFPETYDVRDRIRARYPIELIRVAPALTVAEQAEIHGPELWRRDPDACCRMRKVEPLRAFLKGYDAWITGIRREQAPTRAAARPVEWDAKFGLVKVNPLVRWRAGDVWAYVLAHDVPYNPLHDQGYPSIGCMPCTTPVAPGEDPRSGRWRGAGKTECGLHG
ncbi:MAG: phosphoadenylyl-sulfate reductase [Clostridia bacterium]|nr:phosphoadenylyl-sulfate reductase [Clostridia bacterium]